MSVGPGFSREMRGRQSSLPLHCFLRASVGNPESQLCTAVLPSIMRGLRCSKTLPGSHPHLSERPGKRLERSSCTHPSGHRWAKAETIHQIIAGRSNFPFGGHEISGSAPQ